ncbi:MAG: Rpn family recombination-promoting nuclease/putative transposase [bacterium]
MTPTPHDALFKRTFSDPAHAVGELRTILPPALCARLEFDGLRVESGSFVDDELSQRHADLLYTVPWRDGGEALVYLLFEHQSTPEPLMPFRLLRYMLRIWERWLATRSEARRLPLLIPAVLYHGAEAWTTPLAFEDLIDLPPGLDEPLRPFVPHFRCVLDDLSGVTDAELRARSASAMARLVLFSLRGARTAPDFFDRLAAWTDVVWQVWNAPQGIDALEAIIRYTLQVAAPAGGPDKLKQILERAVGAQGREVVVTIAEQLIEKGIEQGIEKGIEKGIEIGLVRGHEEGQRDTLRRLLEVRFGDSRPRWRGSRRPARRSSRSG